MRFLACTAAAVPLIANVEELALLIPANYQQLRDEPAMVAVFADHAPPPKLEGITEAIDLDEGDTLTRSMRMPSEV